MSKSYLHEAFKKLNVLNEDTFEVDASGLAKLKAFEDEDETTDTLTIIDPDAETETDLSDSYEGKVILDCNVCHSKIFKDPEEVKESESEEVVNEGEECPMCYSVDGYKVVGMVAPYCAHCEEKNECEDEECDDEVEVEDKIEIEESLKESRDLTSDPNTIAGVLAANMDKFMDYTTPAELRAAVITVLDMSDIADKKAVEECKRVLMSRKSVSALLSTIGTYMTGMKTGTSKKYKEALAKKHFVNRKEKLKETFEKVDIETEDEKMSMESEADGKVVVTTEPKKKEDEKEIVVPVDAEIKAEVEETADEDEDSIDVDVEDFDEEEFDDLGESYLKKVYNNVKGYKTTDVASKGNKLQVEGIITFNSGKQKKTSFLFEARDVTKTGKVRFSGENKQISRGKKSFTLTGKVNEGKFISESLNYNYRVKDLDGNSRRLYDTVKHTKKLK